MQIGLQTRPKNKIHNFLSASHSERPIRHCKERPSGLREWLKIISYTKERVSGSILCYVSFTFLWTYMYTMHSKHNELLHSNTSRVIFAFPFEYLDTCVYLI